MLDNSVKPEKARRRWPLRGKGRPRPAEGKPDALTPSGAMSNVELLERLGEILCTVDELGLIFGISQPTVNNRLRDHQELDQAYRRGKALWRISRRRLLCAKAQRNSGEGIMAALYLSQCLLMWPRDLGGDEIIEPPQAAARHGGFTEEQLARISPEEAETFLAIMRKASR